MAIKKNTSEQLEELRLQQVAGTAPTMKANIDKNYDINTHDKDYLHVKLVSRLNQHEQAAYVDQETIKLFYPEFYTQNKDFITAGFFKAEVIHDPRLM